MHAWNYGGRHGRLKFSSNGSLPGKTSINVFSVKAKNQTDFDVTFLFNPCDAPKPLTECDIVIDHPNNIFQFRSKFNPPNVTFGIFGTDTNNYSYFGLRRHVNRYIQDNNIPWGTADSSLQMAILDTSAAPLSNSLPGIVWQEANKQHIDYLVIFFGYSLNFSKGIAPANAVASAAISTIGIASFATFGFGAIAIPNGQRTFTNPIILCKVYSVNPNVCIFNGKETVTSYNDDTVGQVREIMSKLIKKINVVIQ